jgi:opacity protein-like surface antigen
MKKLIFPLLVAGMCAVPSLSYAEMNPYVSVSGGVGFMGNSDEDKLTDMVEYKTGYLFNGALGLKTMFGRAEAEVGYHRNSIDKYDHTSLTDSENLSIWSFMANGYFDYDMSDMGVSPFVTAGLGVANVAWNAPGADTSNTAFAWQAGAGVGFKVAQTVTFDVAYRWFSIPEVYLEGKRYTVNSHNVLAGLRFDF